MRKTFLVLLVLAASVLAYGQGSTTAGPPVAINQFGAPMPSTLVAICNTNPGSATPPCSNTVSLFTDITLSTPCTGAAGTQLLNNSTNPTVGSACSNPGLTDSLGNVIPYSSPGTFWCQYYGPNITTRVVPCIFPGPGGATNPAAPIGSFQGNCAGAFCGIPNSTFNVTTGAVTFPTTNTLNSGLFTNTQMNLFAQEVIGTCNASALFHAQFTASFATEGHTACLGIPSGSTVFQGNALAGYVQNNSPITAVSGVWGFGVSNSSGTGSTTGGTFLAYDTVGVPQQGLYGTQVFCSQFNAASTCHGMLISGFFSPSQPAFAVGIEFAPPTSAACPACYIPQAIRFDTGVSPEASGVAGAAIVFNPVSSASNSNSQGELFVSNDSTTVGGVDTYVPKLTSGGNLDLILSKPGGAVVTNIFQAFDFISQNAGTPASTGVFRGVSADWMAFRNVANSGDVILTHDATDGFTANGPGGLSAVGFNATGPGSGSYYCASGGTPQGVLGELLIACPPTVIGTLVTQGIQYAGQGVLGAYNYQNSVVTPSGTVTSTNMQNFYSGDANHSATVVIGSGTSIGATILCSLLNCPGGTYEVNAYLDITTPCGTSGTYIPWVGYADDSGVRAGSSTTTFIPIQGTGSASATGTLTTTSTNNYGQGDFRLHSTVTKGVLNSNGTALTWVSGSQFNASGAWNNTFIVLGNPGPGGGGQEFQISSCASATACTLTATSGPSNPGIPYTQGNDISYGTTATSCGTAGPMVGKMYLSTVPVL